MTPDEKRIAEIEAKVRPTICPTFSCWRGEKTIEGRITLADFNYLISSLTAWKFVAKMNGDLAKLTPDET